ncbi:MAG TPA: hypothetical protein VGH76_19740 [Actinomycetospora sp.]|uniref:DUF7701 domain-containing protein n=1 Tax=Actinomycetospora sp. TaxID=1872135 RepID=UPI002F3EF394
MTYIDDATHELNAQLSASHAGNGCPPELTKLYALLVLTRGADCTLEDVHDAWAVWTAAERPEHRSLIPFSDLAVDVQLLDVPYRDAIRAAATRLSATA